MTSGGKTLRKKIIGGRESARSQTQGTMSLLRQGLVSQVPAVHNGRYRAQPVEAVARDGVGLSLAVRAPEPDPLLPRRSRLAPPDHHPAPSAGPSRPPVHPVLPPGPGVSRRHVPRPFLVRVKQPVPNLHKSGKVVDRPDRPRRVNPAQEQRFRHIDSPEARQVPLVEQRLADGPIGLPGKARHGGRRVPAGAEQVGAEMPGDLVFPRGRQYLRALDDLGASSQSTLHSSNPRPWMRLPRRAVALIAQI